MEAEERLGLAWWFILGWSTLVAGSLLWNIYPVKRSEEALELARETGFSLSKGLMVPALGHRELWRL